MQHENSYSTECLAQDNARAFLFERSVTPSVHPRSGRGNSCCTTTDQRGSVEGYTVQGPQPHHLSSAGWSAASHRPIVACGPFPHCGWIFLFIARRPVLGAHSKAPVRELESLSSSHLGIAHSFESCRIQILESSKQWPVQSLTIFSPSLWPRFLSSNQPVCPPSPEGRNFNIKK